MGLLDNGLKGSVVTGLAVGIGAVILAPAVLPALAGIAKPLLKAAVKSGFILFEKGKETAAELSEVVEDIVAEAKAEMAEVHEAAVPPAAAAAATTAAAVAVRRASPRRKKKSATPSAAAEGETGA
jgi:Protein of unknown function (DUF5132)